MQRGRDKTSGPMRWPAAPAPLLASLVLLPGLALTGGAVMWAQQKGWVAALGLLLSFGIALVIGLLASGRTRAQALAARMTTELELLARVARSTSSSVFSTDPALRILWVNEAFTRITGYTAEQAIGRRPHELFQNEAADPRTVQLLNEAVAAGVGCRVEVLLRHRAGHHYWMDVDLQPVRGAQGELRGFIDIGTDITARRQMEASLRASEAMLDRAGRLAGVGGWELDLVNGQVHWSRQTYQIHDKVPGAPIPLEEGLNFYGEDGQRQLREAVARAQRQGLPWDLELPLMTALGRFVWVRVVGEALPPSRPGGPVERLVGSVQDVTERRALEEATRRANTVLQGVIDNLPCGLSVYDRELALTAHNAQFRRLLELPDALFAGPVTRFPDIVQFGLQIDEYGPGAKGQAVADDYMAYARRPKDVAFERTRPNGMTIEVRAAPMPGGGFITTYIDLSERKRAQAEIERREQLLRAAIDAVDEAFVLFDREDRLVFCNEKYRSVYRHVAPLLQAGVPFERIVRASAESGAHLEAAGRVDEWVAERLAAHRSGDVKMVQCLDGVRWLRVIERRMPDGHIAGFRIDITDLMHATEAAEKASVAKGQFLANMSHEIRTPMNAVLGMLRLLQKTPLTPRQQDYAAKAEGAARSLLGLLNDILDFSKVDAGKMSLDPQPLRIDELLRHLSVILGANLGRKPIELLFDIDPRLPRCVLADALRLQQVLINLAGNAIKFTEGGEVVVQLKVIELAAAAVTLEVAVRDTGIGIAPEHQTRIFSGFTQAEASTSRRFGGTGLGLAISQRLVQLMGAELQLDSAPGRGSRFFFQLRLDLPAQPPEPPPDGAALRVLLVDDNASARELLAHMGASLGWHVDTAEGGEAALAKVAEAGAAGAPYQVVLVDWAMPGMDGWQTSQRIRALAVQGGHPTLPVLVMVTAHGREMLAQRSEQEQGLLDGFLVKPVTASMLYDAVVDARAGSAGSGGGAPVPLPPGPAVRRLAGLRLLVVEDNLNNQQVARELLEDEGAAVLLASDGQQALSQLALAKQRGGIDAVLMDVQMPVMDGCTATRLIRRQLGLGLPIVAMTANALATDRQACLDAGMNEYVGKPFDVDHLVAVLLRQCGVAPQPTRATPRPALAPALLDEAQRAGIEFEDAVARLSGKRELFERMVAALAQTADELPAQLDGTDGAAALHGLRGLAATLGACALAERAGQGERLLQAGAPLPPDWRAQFDALLRRDLAALAGLARQLPELPVAASAPADLALQPALHSLIELLDGSDLAALAAFSLLRPTLFAAQPVATAALDAEIAALDFGAAARRCRTLLEPAP